MKEMVFHEKMTGYPSIDKPWLKYYKENAEEGILSDGSYPGLFTGKMNEVRLWLNILIRNILRL